MNELKTIGREEILHVSEDSQSSWSTRSTALKQQIDVPDNSDNCFIMSS